MFVSSDIHDPDSHFLSNEVMVAVVEALYQCRQCTRSLLHDFGRDLLHASGWSAGTGIELTDVAMREAIFAHQSHRLFEIFFGLSWEAANDVRCQFQLWTCRQQRVADMLKLYMAS